MPFKSLDDILKPDPRFADLCVVQGGIARRMTLADHHGEVADISLSDAVPGEVGAAFDRARNTVIYAFFDYDLFVVGEVQAFGAFELALKHRLNGHGGAARGTLRNLVDRARKGGFLPPLTPAANALADPIEALIALRTAFPTALLTSIRQAWRWRLWRRAHFGSPTFIRPFSERPLQILPAVRRLRGAIAACPVRRAAHLPDPSA